jgi:photosystem II PsbY protein
MRSPNIFNICYSKALDMDFDFRLLIVLAPLAAAAGWAVFNILPVALKQIQELLREKT